MRFLVDRCVGVRLSVWLRGQGHDVREARERGSDPGDQEILAWAAAEGRVLITLDADFGALVFLKGKKQAGLLRLPDVSAADRIALMSDLIRRHRRELESGAVVTVRRGKIRISRPPGRP